MLVHLVGCSVLRNMTRIEHVDIIRVDDLPYIVAYHYHRPPFLYRVYRVFYLFCGDSVETCGWLVEEDDRRVLQEHARYRYPLLLSSAEL